MALSLNINNYKYMYENHAAYHYASDNLVEHLMWNFGGDKQKTSEFIDSILLTGGPNNKHRFNAIYDRHIDDLNDRLSQIFNNIDPYKTGAKTVGTQEELNNILRKQIQDALIDPQNGYYKYPSYNDPRDIRNSNSSVSAENTVKNSPKEINEQVIPEEFLGEQETAVEGIYSPLTDQPERATPKAQPKKTVPERTTVVPSTEPEPKVVPKSEAQRAVQQTEAPSVSNRTPKASVTTAEKKALEETAEEATKRVSKKRSFTQPFGGPIGTGLAAWTAWNSYREKRDEGMGRLGSAAHAATSLILPEFLGWKTTLLLDAASFVPKMAVQGMQTAAQVSREYERGIRDQSPFRANTFVDSQQIYTMRQAGMALAEQSKYSLQQTLLGNEAQYMHR